MSWHRPNSTAGGITSPFGPRGPIPGAPDASRYHLGVDLRAGTLGISSDLFAAEDGRVRRIYKTPLGAWVLEIDHGGGVMTRYAHMQRNGISVSVGDRVTGGQRVAAASKSGAPTIHLHFEVLVNGKQVDPVPFLRARGVNLAVTSTSGGGSNTGTATKPPSIPGAPAPIIPVPEEDAVRGDIESFYRYLIGREGSTKDVDAWAVSSAVEGLTRKQLVNRFLDSRAEVATVVNAFNQFLGHAPNQSQIDSWLSSRPTVRQVRDGIANSPEAKLKK